MNLQGKKFKSISSSGNAEVDSNTVFEYRQKGNIVWATYEGGEILFGTLSGRWENEKLIFTYQHQNLKREFLTGKCESIPELVNGKIRLHEKWRWTCNDYSNGESVIEEI